MSPRPPAPRRSLAEYEEIIDVNFRAVVRLTHTLLPALRAEPGAHLVNVSSLFGLVAPAGQTAYAASKFAVRGFSEALRAELHGEVGVTTVHPGGIKTRIAESARIGSGVDQAEYQALGRPVEEAAEEVGQEALGGLSLGELGPIAMRLRLLHVGDQPRLLHALEQSEHCGVGLAIPPGQVLHQSPDR